MTPEEAIEHAKSGCSLYAAWFDNGTPDMRGNEIAPEPADG